MKNLNKKIAKSLNLLFIPFLIIFSSFHNLYAYEINWTEVAKTSTEIQYIDTSSIKYNNRDMLSVITRSSEINPENNNILNTSSYLLAIDCENRLFSKLPINSELKQAKNWNKPINNILIKKTIINTCSY